MTSLRIQGYSLIELLAVIAILGFASSSVFLAVQDDHQSTLERTRTAIMRLLATSRNQALYTGRPTGLAISRHNAAIVSWAPDLGQWVYPHDASSPSISTSPELPMSLYPGDQSQASLTSIGEPQLADCPVSQCNALVYWPDGSSTGGRVSLGNVDETAVYLTVSRAGAITRQ